MAKDWSKRVAATESEEQWNSMRKKSTKHIRLVRFNFRIKILPPAVVRTRSFSVVLPNWVNPCIYTHTQVTKRFQEIKSLQSIKKIVSKTRKISTLYFTFLFSLFSMIILTSYNVKGWLVALSFTLTKDMWKFENILLLLLFFYIKNIFWSSRRMCLVRFLFLFILFSICWHKNSKYCVEHRVCH